ncbi:hypothetical protein SUDANB120_05912 [Streptomyces sp. enrichment culture]|uniref:DUF4142 domain-containing protein n=1 Tax=Streptomyces sp. enrichment culture TaxID=1795815 RepID=UPI003F56B7C4
MAGIRWAAPAAAAAAVLGLAVPAAAAPSPGSPDAAFVQAAHQANLAEIAAGQDAQRNGGDTCVKDAGAKLVRDHTELDAELTDLAQEGRLQLPDAPTAEQKAALDKVKAQAGTSGYDKAWLTAQEKAHTATLAAIDKQITDGKDADTVDAAEDARPVVAAHLEMVRGGTCHAMPSDDA